MSTSEDVKTLFRRFGGQADSYQEVVREDQAAQSLGRWTMLGQVDVGRPQAIPSARRAIKTAETRHGPEVDEVQLPPEPVTAVVVAPPPDNTPTALVATPSRADRPDPLGPRSPMTPRQRASAPKTVASKPVPTQAAGRRRPVGFSTPQPTPQPDAQAEPAPATRGVSPLAARLKSPAPARPSTGTHTPATDNSLPGLFSRLSGTPSPKTKPGVLQRKFNK